MVHIGPASGGAESARGDLNNSGYGGVAVSHERETGLAERGGPAPRTELACQGSKACGSGLPLNLVHKGEPFEDVTGLLPAAYVSNSFASTGLHPLS
jgi:hypothetical protein